MADETDWTQPAMILALAVLVAVAGTTAYYVLPIIGAAVGLAFSVATTGLATSGAVATWVAPVASGGVAVIGVTVAVTGIKKVSDSVQEQPYDWGMPLLAAFGGFTSTVATGTALEDDVSKWLFGGVTAFLIVVSGACYRRPSLTWKILSVALYLLPPATLLAWSAVIEGQTSVAASFRSVSTSTWISIGSLLIVGVLIGSLAHLDAKGAPGGSS